MWSDRFNAAALRVSWYRAAALLWLDVCLAFVLLNGAQVGLLWLSDQWKEIRAHWTPTDPVSEKYGFSQVVANYPGWDKNALKQLLKETWSRPYVFEPGTQFKEGPHVGTYVNVDARGFRLTREQGPWPPSPSDFNVFLFGGSTTFNYGVADEDTIASHLQQGLSEIGFGRPVRVYNFGRGLYNSSLERLLFEKLVAEGHVPQMAVFLDGLNEFFFVNDEPPFTDLLRHLFEEAVRNEHGRPELLLRELIVNLPVVRAVRDAPESRFTVGASWTLIRGLGVNLDQESDYNDPTILDKALARYGRNKAMIEAVAKAYGVTPVFIWHAVPMYAATPSAEPHKFFGHTFSKFGYPRMAASAAKGELSGNFGWCAEIQRGVSGPLYVDSVHFSPILSRLTARCILKTIRERRLLPDAGAISVTQQRTE
jgi:hypothetical protein